MFFVKKMEWLIIVISISTLASTLPVEKESKSFSLFSLVSFPNEECATTMRTLITGAPVSGLCLTTEECTESGGKPEGNCASGFGVCCFISVEESGAELTKNITYIQNSGFPSLIGDVAVNPMPTTILTFTLEGSTDICQTRWDFEDVVLQQPLAAQTDPVNGQTVNGQCGGTNGDSIVIASPSTDIVGFESLCGTLTGHHIYIPNSGLDDAATITITIGQGVFGRRWRIKTTRIECTNPSRAPVGCLQFFTGIGGRVTSFNKLDVNPILIRNLFYGVCIRAEKGFCSLNVAQSRNANNVPDSFRLGVVDDVTGAGSTDKLVGVVGTMARVGTAECGKNNDVQCICTGDVVGIGGNVFCGNLLAARDKDATAGVITLNTPPFRIYVATENTERTENTGFDLTYRQVPC